MIKIDLERNIYLDELFIKRRIKTCVCQFKSIRDIKEGIMNELIKVENLQKNNSKKKVKEILKGEEYYD